MVQMEAKLKVEPHNNLSSQLRRPSLQDFPQLGHVPLNISDTLSQTLTLLSPSRGGQIHNADFGASPQNRTLSDLSTTPPQAQNNAKRQLPPLGSPLNPGSATNNGFVPSPPEPDTPTNEPDELENDELEYEEEPERRVESAPPAQPPNPFAPVSNLFQAVPGALSAVSSVYYTTPLSTVDPNAVGGAKDTPSPDETEAARERFKSKMAHEHGPPSNMREQAQRSSSPTAAPPTTPQSRPQKRGDLDLDFNKIIHEPQDPNATPQEQDEDRRKGFVNIDSNHKPEDNDNAQYQQRGSHFSHGHGGQTQESGRPAADRAGGRVPDSREGSGLADHGRGGGMGNGPQ
ncbi:hypothetical protein NLI96_g3548 [Meripilus lineatus]|uniref:Uncharacterized protein n=1 Tax=Meripilus lineatus TaxID=2056292 RepID=A0AAD5V6I8_9APHY|nr:hypothetical protein NLI96_g3548 [Physisporinus lineatus]